ncbi:hypothetical protein TWF696_007553 [Orbilia brochopaga]|uniref:Uncharacterized protein n=1 Tax=Orbilia brochopaga TaxID=3140254 RepID=A0AAV9ULN4_9PEZI
MPPNTGFDGPPHQPLQGRCPPAIPKPRMQEGRSITNTFLAGVFSNAGPYYRTLTEDWRAVNPDAIFSKFKKCAQAAVEINRRPDSTDGDAAFRLSPRVPFSFQSHRAVQQTYDVFLGQLRVWPMSSTSYALISDMLLSTENDDGPDSKRKRDYLWLFKWAVTEFERREKKKTRRMEKQAIRAATAPAPQVATPANLTIAPDNTIPNANADFADANIRSPESPPRRRTSARTSIKVSDICNASSTN